MSDWQTPKTDWAAGDVPTATDFNRIEGNLLVLLDQFSCLFWMEVSP